MRTLNKPVAAAVEKASQANDSWIADALETAKADVGIMDLMALSGYISEIQRHPLEVSETFGYSWVGTGALSQR
mgnify:CR=1 FL=1|jgi:ABC-type amino acid transport substrate-binding protein